MLLPIASTLENVAPDNPETEILPSFDRTTVDVRSKRELRVSWLPNPEAVIV
jgi:hypothetical protein